MDSINNSQPKTELSGGVIVRAEAGFRYVLILEWLDEHDERTGAALHDYLQAIGMPSEFVVCESPADVQHAIESALANIAERGRPLIHIEAHGTSPDDGYSSEMAFGSTEGDGVRWADLGNWLAPLNRACDYQLVVIGATCFGIGAIGAMKVNIHNAPFSVCIGFTTKVAGASIREAMKEFYRSIKRGDDFSSALANSSRELRTGERLEFASAKKLGYAVLRGVYDDLRTPDALNSRVNRLLEQVKHAGLPIADSYVAALPALLHERTKVRAKEAWDCWFPPELQNRMPAYRLDWAIVEMDIRN